VEFLTEDEAAALVAAPDPGTWIGRRDRALLFVAVQTGLRNSEITGCLTVLGISDGNRSLRRCEKLVQVGPDSQLGPA